MRHLRHPVGECVSLRLGRDKPGRPLRAREEDFGRIEHVSGDPGAIRTRDPQIRNLMLYPAELRGRPGVVLDGFPAGLKRGLLMPRSRHEKGRRADQPAARTLCAPAR